MEPNNTTDISDAEIHREQIGQHEKILHFHAHPDGARHTMSVFIDGYLDQYISLNDAAIDAIISKREAMRARVAEIDARGVD